MPGRQSHGRSLMGNAQPSTKKGKGKNSKSKSKAQAHAQDAYAIAAKQIEPERMTRRGRDLELEPERHSRGGKHSREADDDDDDEEDEEEERPQKKRARQTSDDDDDGSDAEGGNDSDGNEWHIGVNGDDEDSELDSDEAFGDSDEEKFEGFTFRGSRSQKKKKKENKEDSDDDDGDDGESLGSDAIDLAAALDQSTDDDDDDEGSAGDTESGSEDEAGSDTESDDDEDVDPSKLGELHNLIKDYAKDADEDADNGPSSKQTISLEDLGLSAVKDPLIKKALKLMKREETADASKKSASKKLDVPLPRRQQDQLLRAAAYEKTNETLDRWNETVKHNRRADHLMFPLPQNAHDAGLDNQELLPLTKKTADTQLEQTIMSIMEESGLGPSAKAKEKQDGNADADGEEQTISRSELKDLWAQRRKDRELQSREQARSKRIKKIKSKTYRRVHRKERLGDEAKELETMRANGEIDSEEEREAAHRRRALERVGAKHRESKWAKMGSKAGRAVWDDDYRAGLTDMARRNEELRKRVEGKADSGSDEESDGASGSEDEVDVRRLLDGLDATDEAQDDKDQLHSGLMSLKFMQRAEAQRKKDNDEEVAHLARTLVSGSEEEEDDTEAQVGRQTFGMGQDKKAVKATKKTSTISNGALSNGGKNKTLDDLSSTAASLTQSVPSGAGDWAKSAVPERKKGRKAIRDATVAELELTELELPSVPAPKRKAVTEKDVASAAAAQGDNDDSSDDGIHLPLAFRDHELVSRVFAGDDVDAEFEAEKAAIMSEDDEKEIKTTLPGWGSWTGDGISKRAQKRNKGKVTTTKKAGIKKKDRQDVKLSKVIVNEKTNRKTGKYLATQLPHPFESRQQYERSLRLPVGPEWMTKESFQQATKPRVIVKQGIIAPMAKPTI